MRFTCQLLIGLHLVSPFTWAEFQCPSSLLGAREVSVSSPSFLSLMNGEAFPFLVDHRVGGQIIVPGAALLTNSLEAARFGMPAGKTAVVLEGFRIRKPVRLGTLNAPSGPVALRSVLVPRGNKLEVQLSSPLDLATAQTHSRARASYENSLVALQTDQGALSAPRTLSRAIAVEDIYSVMRNKGLDYGPTFSVLTQPSFSKNLAQGIVRLHPSVAVDSSAAPHPTLLDAGFHLLAGFAIADGIADPEPKVAIPFGMERVVWNSTLPPCRQYHVSVRLHEATNGQEGVVEYDLELTHENGQVALQIIQGRLIVIEPSRLGEDA